MTDVLSNAEAARRYPRTVEAIKAGEIYPHCPRCDGSCDMFVYTHLGDGFRPSRGEYIKCALCHGTGEASLDRAIGYMEGALDGEE